jgi:hypothetical protein
MIKNDTIIALATPSGVGAISVLRLSGENSIAIVAGFFKSVKKGKCLKTQKTHTIHLGHIINKGLILDEVLVSILKTQGLIQEKMSLKFRVTDPVLFSKKSFNYFYRIIVEWQIMGSLPCVLF